MLIVSKKAIYRMVNNYPINDTNYSLWQAVVPFHDIVNRNFNSIFICDNVFHIMLLILREIRFGIVMVEH